MATMVERTRNNAVFPHATDNDTVQEPIPHASTTQPLSGQVHLCSAEDGFATPPSHPPASLANGSHGHSTGYLRGASGHPIFYNCWRPGVHPRGTVLILHGLGEHGGRYRHLVAALLRAGYAVYAHDHHGFGRSGGPRAYVHAFRDYLIDVTQVLSMARHREPGLPCCLYGHSMGGLLGLLYLMETPGAVDMAVIASPSLQPQSLSLVNRLLKAILVTLHQARPTLTFRQRGSLDVLTRDWEEVQNALKDSLGVRHRSARWVVEFFRVTQEVRERAGEVTVPILMMQGLADAVVSPAATQAFFSHTQSADKTLRLYDGYFHELHNDLGRERPLSAVIDWLDARCRATSLP